MVKVKVKREESREDPVMARNQDESGQNRGPGESTIEEGKDILALKEEEIKQLQDRVLRLAAEMENTRKRLEREKSDGISFANESLIRELLPVIDNLEMALQHGENEADSKSVLDGVRLTLKAFSDVLSRFGCAGFQSVGKTFDPKYHEAVLQMESGEHPPRTVLQEFRKGYLLHDRLLRPASVVVSAGSGEVS